MTLRLCTIAPASSTKEYARHRRPGHSWDIARPIGHSTMTVITSCDPPIIRLWDPYVDVEISRRDAAVLIWTTRKNRKYRNESDYYHQLRKIGQITIHDIKRWAAQHP